MGRFSYEGTVKAEFEDRTLAHLAQVIGPKLRRGESFFFTWRDDASVGTGRVSVWIHAHANLTFTYSGSRSPSLNPAWLQVLTRAANSSTGLYVVPEPQESTFDAQPTGPVVTVSLSEREPAR